MQDQTNSVPVTLNGVVSTLVLTLTPSAVTAGTAQAVTATLGGKDASGNTIIGPGSFVDATGAALTPSLQSSDTTNFAVGSQNGDSWAVAYNGAAVAAPTITLIAGALTNATQQITVNPAPTSSPGGTNVITNGDFTTNAFDGTAGWYRCYATRVTTAGQTPVNASPAPVNQLAVVAGATSAPRRACAGGAVSAVPGNTPPPSGNASRWSATPRRVRRPIRSVRSPEGNKSAKTSWVPHRDADDNAKAATIMVQVGPSDLSAAAS